MRAILARPSTLVATALIIMTALRVIHLHDLDADSISVTSSIHEHRSTLRSVLADYLLTDPFQTLSWAMSLNLGGTAPQGPRSDRVIHPSIEQFSKRAIS